MPECIGFSEIGKTANAILRYLYPNVRNYGDAAGIVCDELPDFDLLVGGFPCQAFSIAGKRKGFADTRGTLFFEIARILEAKRPGHFLLENVAGLLSHDDGQTFRTIIATLDALGYDLEWTVINSKHHGVPQNRERVFIVGHPRGGSCGEILSFGDSDSEAVQPGYVEPVSGTISTKNQSGQGQFDGSSTLITKDISYAIDSNYHKGCNDLTKGRRTIVDGSSRVTVGTLRTHKDGEGFREMQSNVSPSLNARARQDGSQQPVVAITERRTSEAKQIRRESRKNGRDFSPRRGKEIVERTDNLGNTVTATPSIEMAVIDHQRIRRLTPTECARLQGFADDHADFGMFQDKNGEWQVKEISDTGKYQCFGNAVTVNVIEAIVTRMLEKGCLG